MKDTQLKTLGRCTWTTLCLAGAMLITPMIIAASVTDEMAESEGAAVSLGDELFFISNPTLGRSSLPFNLYRANWDSSELTPLLTSAEAQEVLGWEIIPDPSHRRLATVRRQFDPETRGNPGRLTLVDLDTGECETLVDEDRVILHPSFSPDGSMIAFFSVPPAIDRQQFEGFPEGGCRVDVVGVETRESLFHSDEWFEAYPRPFLTWSPDSRRVAHIVPSSTEPCSYVCVVDIESGRSSPVRLDETYHPEGVLWAQGNDLIIAGVLPWNSSETPVPGMFRLNIETREWSPLIEGVTLMRPESMSPERDVFLFLWAAGGGVPMEQHLMTTSGEPLSPEQVQDRRFQGRWRLQYTASDEAPDVQNQ